MENRMIEFNDDISCTVTVTVSLDDIILEGNEDSNSLFNVIIKSNNGTYDISKETYYAIKKLLNPIKV